MRRRVSFKVTKEVAGKLPNLFVEMNCGMFKLARHGMCGERVAQ